jgi:hypothetical protein
MNARVNLIVRTRGELHLQELTGIEGPLRISQVAKVSAAVVTFTCFVVNAVPLLDHPELYAFRCLHQSTF